jgi:hypothetical protein
VYVHEKTTNTANCFRAQNVAGKVLQAFVTLSLTVTFVSHADPSKHLHFISSANFFLAQQAFQAVLSQFETQLYFRVS